MKTKHRTVKLKAKSDKTGEQLTIPPRNASMLKYDFTPLYEGSYMERPFDGLSSRSALISAVRREIEKNNLDWKIVTRKVLVEKGKSKSVKRTGKFVTTIVKPTNDKFVIRLYVEPKGAKKGRSH